MEINQLQLVILISLIIKQLSLLICFDILDWLDICFIVVVVMWLSLVLSSSLYDQFRNLDKNDKNYYKSTNFDDCKTQHNDYVLWIISINLFFLFIMCSSDNLKIILSEKKLLPSCSRNQTRVS